MLLDREDWTEPEHLPVIGDGLGHWIQLGINGSATKDFHVMRWVQTGFPRELR